MYSGFGVLAEIVPFRAIQSPQDCRELTRRPALSLLLPMLRLVAALRLKRVPHCTPRCLWSNAQWLAANHRDESPRNRTAKQWDCAHPWRHSTPAHWSRPRIEETLVDRTGCVPWTQKSQSMPCFRTQMLHPPLRKPKTPSKVDGTRFEQRDPRSFCYRAEATSPGIR